MKVRRLDNGQIITVGDPIPKKSSFLDRQPKPVIGTDGKLYKDGVWVAHKEKPLSPEAAKVIKEAAAPAAPKATGVAPGLTPKTEESGENKEG